MKTLSLLCVCAVLSVCWSTNDVEPEVVLDPEADVAAPTAAPAPADSSSSSSSSSSESNSDSASSSSESNSSSSESDSSASDSSASKSASSSSSSSSSSESNSVEAAPVVIMKRDLASVVLRRSRRAVPAGGLTPLQQESLREVCELNVACDEMADTQGIVAAYTTYYGPVPF